MDKGPLWQKNKDNPNTNKPPWEIYNLGNNNPEVLLDFINVIEKTIGKKAKKNFLPIQPGDVEKTFADIKESKKDLNFLPKTKISEGIPKFINWYKKYYKI